MVLSNVPRTARTALIVSQTNVCGGVKKGGLSPSVGVTSAVLPAISIRGVNSIPQFCLVYNTSSSQSAIRASKRF